jgi:ubiquinone/menaquinone biosynthesis C-methylase UbiE
MLRWARVAAPSAQVAVARAEQLPVASGAVDLIAAAGSLNYVDLPAFFPEARRILCRGGRLVVYDFGAGRSFPDSDVLDQWFDEFELRYPFRALPGSQPERSCGSGGGLLRARRQ